MSEFTREQAAMIEEALATSQLVAHIQGESDKATSLQEIRIILSSAYQLGTDFGDRQ